MKGFSEWFGRRSYVEMSLILAVVWGVGSEGVHALLSGEVPDATDLIIRLVASLIFGFVLAAITRRRIRRSGGQQLAHTIQLAVKSGALPADADAAEWLPALRFQEMQLARTLWLTPVVFGLFTVLGVYLTVVATDGTSQALGALCIAAFVGVTVYSVLFARRRLPVVRTFIDRLRAESDA